MSIFQWLSWIDESSSVKGPSLVCSVMAVPESGVVHVGVSSSMNIKALGSVVTDVSLEAVVVRSSDVRVVLISSDNGSRSNIEVASFLVGKGEASLSIGSDGSRSLVEDEPLL